MCFVLATPLTHFSQEFFERSAVVGQRIFNARRYDRKDFAMDDAVVLELAHLPGEHLLRRARHLAPQFVKAQRTLAEVEQNHWLPFAADDPDRHADWAFVGFQ